MIKFETEILNMIQNIKNPFFDGFFSTVTHLGDGGLIWICIAAAAIIYGCVKKRKAAALCGITMLTALILGVISGNLILKPLVARQRPFDGLDIALLINAPTDFSFPSGHTLSSFAASVSILFYSRRWGVAAVALACVIAFSRLYLYVHFPTDILGGIILGIICAAVSKYTVSKARL